ncbi:FAD-binding protein [Chryseobacterium sp.]|uniref:FAD-binding protein n=1 Tax=Chryseobacterium sp. TaxID=1871047 RepID=UPI0025B80F38|nr:FAD-binding protein [Chryseobacterium sp.]
MSHQSKTNKIQTTVDLLIIGSGTGMAAALAAKEKGLKCMVIEKSRWIGGSTAMSEGTLWIPANQLTKSKKNRDNIKKGAEYLESIIDNSSLNHLLSAFLKNGEATIKMLERTTPLKFSWIKGFPDYYSENPGGLYKGRTIECKPFNISTLGKEALKIRPGIISGFNNLPQTRHDYKWTNLFLRKPSKSIPIIMKRYIQKAGNRITGKKYVVSGQALAAGMFAGLIRAHIPVLMETKLIELLIHNDNVYGAVIEKNNKRFNIKTKKGVILATGGFEHNLRLRQNSQPTYVEKDRSLGAEDNTGDGIIAAVKINAHLSHMDQSWWFPTIPSVLKGGKPALLFAERSYPGCFIINKEGKRFINETLDYVSFGQKIMEMEKKLKPVKNIWLIFDETYRKRYVFAGTILPGRPLPYHWYKTGVAFTADTPELLAKAIDVPVANFTETLKRYNRLAIIGKDLDFAKGEKAQDRYYGDPTIKPNPNMDILTGKLYAVKIVLSDLGTNGGLSTDEYARVLKTNKTPVNGLYAIGNTSANIFGKIYPGAGATIAQGLIYGYIAACHAAFIR